MVAAADGVAEEEGADEGDLELVVLCGRGGGGAGGEPGGDGLGVVGRAWEMGRLDEEAVGGGARVRLGELGLGLEDDLEGGAG